MQLTLQQKLEFYENGYLKIAGVVPPIMVEAAKHAINYSLGEEGMNKDDLPFLRAQSYCKEIRSTTAITDLLNRTPIFPLVESMIGIGSLLPVGGGQIALRFPRVPYSPLGEPRGHLDGLGSGTNGMEKGKYRRGFTALAVVLLSDLPEAYSGNFTVWPKSHRFFEEYFIKNGHEMLANGMPKVELPEGPVQITGKPGDVVITHHQLVHAAGPNHSSNIRYAAIFRLRHKDCETNGSSVYTDIWKEWSGIREALQEKEQNPIPSRASVY
jgi:hypothetical protein